MYLIRVSFIKTLSQSHYKLSLEKSSWGSTNDIHFNMSGFSNIREVQASKKESRAWLLFIECAGIQHLMQIFDAILIAFNKNTKDCLIYNNVLTPQDLGSPSAYFVNVLRVCCAQTVNKNPGQKPSIAGLPRSFLLQPVFFQAGKKPAIAGFKKIIRF